MRLWGTNTHPFRPLSYLSPFLRIGLSMRQLELSDTFKEIIFLNVSSYSSFWKEGVPSWLRFRWSMDIRYIKKSLCCFVSVAVIVSFLFVFFLFVILCINCYHMNQISLNSIVAAVGCILSVCFCPYSCMPQTLYKPPFYSPTILRRYPCEIFGSVLTWHS